MKDEELNDENTIDVCLIKIGQKLYQINSDESEEMIYLVEPYCTAKESKEQLSFTKALWYHSVLLNDDTIPDVPVLGLWIPSDEFIDIIDFHRINK